MNNRFSTDFINGLSSEVKEAISPEPLNSLAHNPQALLSAEAQAELKAIFDQLGTNGAAFFADVLEALKLALNSAITQIFLISFFVVIVAWIINLFIKEIPLRKQNV
jgi:hypothetical protein